MVNAHSVHRSALAPIGRPRSAVTLSAQFVKNFHDCALAWVREAARRDVLRLDEEAFGFGEGVAHVVDSELKVTAHGRGPSPIDPRESRPIFGSP